MEARRPLVRKRNASEEVSADETFHALFIRFARPVLSFIHTMLGDRGRAEELTQETFIRAFRNLDSKLERTAFSTWVFGIAHNVVREAVKEKYKLQHHVPLDDSLSSRLESEGIPPDERLINEELHRRISAALAALPDERRVVFILKIIHDMKYEEIARITGSSIGKLKTDLHRARLEMRQRLHPYLGGREAGSGGGA